MRARSFAEAMATGATHLTDDAGALIDGARHRHRHRRDGKSRRGHPACAEVVRDGQARRDGQRRSGRARGTAPRPPRARRRRRLFARVRRPACAHLRDRRLVPRRGICRRRRGQGHEVPARVPRVDARHGVAVLRLFAGARRRGRFQRADVQLVPGRHQERDRNGGRRQRDGIDARAGGPCFSSLRRRRPAAHPAPGGGRRPAAPRRAGGSDLEPRARRPAGVPRFALGRLRHVPPGRGRRRGLRAPLLRRVRVLDRSVGPLLRDVQALSCDRARARHQRRIGRPARRAHRSADRVARRRRRDGKARSRGRRDARRRRRLHGVRQARSRRGRRSLRVPCRSDLRTA